MTSAETHAAVERAVTTLREVLVLASEAARQLRPTDVRRTDGRPTGGSQQ